MAEAQPLKVKGVPVPYMSVQDLWNDRRDPHANPMSSSPRREGGRASGPSQLGGLVHQIFHPGKPEDIAAHYPLASKRLSDGGR